MRIALVLDRFEPARGGVEQWTARFAAALVRDGREVHVVARSFASTGEAELDRALRCHPVNCGGGKLAFGAAAEQVLRRLDVDVIHDMGFGWYADVIQPHGGSRMAAARRNRAMRGRVAGTTRAIAGSVTPREREFRALARRQYGEEATDRGPKRFVAISRMVADDLVADYGLDRRDVRLVYNGVETRRFTPADRERWRGDVRGELDLGPGCAFLIAAHNLKLKGLPTLLRAFAETHAVDPRSRLVVAGGKRLGEFRRAAGRLGVGGAVRWLGPVDDVRPYYAAADAYVHPTHYDPCSLVTMEAAACGLPVVTSRYGGVSELITPGVEGELIDEPTDVAALADRMRLLLDPGRRDRCGAAARRLALSRPFERNVAEMLAVYDELLAGRGRRRRAA